VTTPRLTSDVAGGPADRVASTRPGARVQPLWPFVAVTVAAILAVHAGIFIRDDLLADRLLQDTDGYMWLNRVTHLWETGDWFEHTYPRVNPPDGHVQHWTRPFDVLLLGGGVALSPLVGFHRGLYYWAVVVPPLMHMLTVVILVWAVKPLVRRRLLPRPGVPTLLLVFIAQVGAFQPFIVGRPDHHAPMAMLFVAYLGFLCRLLLDRRHSTRSAIGLGLVSAMAVWILIEALVFIVVGMLGLGLSWLLGNNRLARLNAIHGAALFAGIIAAWVSEWGPRALGAREIDMLSVVHVALFGFTALFWASLWWASETHRVRRLRAKAIVAGVGAVVVLGGTFLVFPEFLRSPFADVDPLLGEIWLYNIVELQPLLASAGDIRTALARVTLFGGISIAVLPFLAARIVREPDREHRVLWLVFAAAIVVYFVMTLQQRRWADYLALSSVIPFSVVAFGGLGHIGERIGGWRLKAIRPPVLLGLAFGPVLLGSALGTGLASRDQADRPHSQHWDAANLEADPTVSVQAAAVAHRTCDLARIAEVVNDGKWFPGRDLILAHTDHGPELLYRTRHGVLSITNHRRQPGFTFTWDVLTSTDHELAAAALRERGVGIVVLCASDLRSGFFPMLGTENSFLRYLAAGGAPAGYAVHAATPHWRIYRRQP
jgi:hypothetical protein